MYLITGAGGGVGGVSRRVIESLLDGGEPVRAMVHHDDDRAEQLRGLGADVVVGDLINAGDIVAALDGARRMFFNMSVSLDYLRATAEVCAVALERGRLDAIVNMSQMTVSQMTLTSTAESKQQRLHWLSEHVFNWSRLPVIHVRPTVFLDNPLFTSLSAPVIRQRGVLTPLGLPEHVQQHIATIAQLHRDDRYNRVTDDVERLTGRPAQTVAQYVASNPDLFY